MKLKGIRYDDMCQYKKISLFLVFPYCNFKCEKEYGDGTQKFCQNSELTNAPLIDADIKNLLDIYRNSNLMEAVVCGGLEPLDS